MFSTRAALPPTGVTLPPDEYERHKAAYRAILNRRENGVDLIQDGVVFDRVRFCQMENGVAGDCLASLLSLANIPCQTSLPFAELVARKQAWHDVAR